MASNLRQTCAFDGNLRNFLKRNLETTACGFDRINRHRHDVRVNPFLKMNDQNASSIYRFGPASLVDKIAIAGLERTKLHTVLREFEGLEGLGSIDEVYLYLQQAHETLMTLDLFEAVDILIDESAEVR